MEQKVKITWLGTAAIRLEADSETVLFDPFVQLVGGENPNCLDDFLQDQTICCLLYTSWRQLRIA